MSRRAAAVALAALCGLAAPAAAATHLVVISGLGGDEAFSASFHEWSIRLLDGARAAGVPEANLVYLAEDPARDADRIAGESRKTTIESTLRAVGERAGTEGELWIVIFGHGSVRGADPTVNLPGPDLSAEELAALLDGLPVENVVVVNASSASGDFVRVLSAPGRAIVTATRSAGERHAPMFGGFFSESFAGNQADVDKDRRVSLLEAFEYARAAVTRAFEADQRLPTEHALLDDNGDRTGSTAPEPSAAGDGAVASRLFLAGAEARAAGSPELDELEARKDQLEDRIAELRTRRPSLDEELYLEELESLLLELARTNEAIERLAAPAEKSG